MSLGGAEILVILLVALIVFGPHRLPELSRQLGGALRDFKHMQDSVKREISEAINLAPNPSQFDPSETGATAAAPSYDDAANLPHIENQTGDAAVVRPALPTPPRTSVPLDPPSSGSFS